MSTAAGKAKDGCGSVLTCKLKMPLFKEFCVSAMHLHESIFHLNCRLWHIHISIGEIESEVTPLTPAAIILNGAVMASHSH